MCATPDLGDGYALSSEICGGSANRNGTNGTIESTAVSRVRRRSQELVEDRAYLPKSTVSYPVRGRTTMASPISLWQFRI